MAISYRSKIYVALLTGIFALLVTLSAFSDLTFNYSASDKLLPADARDLSGIKVQTTLPTIEAVKSRPKDVLLYVYYETDDAKRNLQFFLDHALHSNMDFIFIINGEELSIHIPEKNNIQVIHRPNTCYDLGSMGEVLNANNQTVLKKYDRFIMMNASVRGPLLPGWARNIGLCWSNIFFGQLSETTKLAGLTANCVPDYPKHIQSMMLAVDRTGMDLMLSNLGCHDEYDNAVMYGETALTQSILNDGYAAEPIFSIRYSDRYQRNADFWDHCEIKDVLFGERYAGMDVHPFDTIFAKTHRSGEVSTPYTPAGQLVVDRLTEWADASRYSSYHYC